jgi:hypothetical protein
VGEGRKKRALSRGGVFLGFLISGGIFALGDRDEGGIEG